MKKEQQDEVMATVECEGFDYAFCDYSDFSEIEDEEFHKAREAYKEAAIKLKQIIGFYEW